ncbi:hypothetical protein, partial [Micromonospora echinospora]|uniref:hypothetical protein n=1 Tax=Micromonospora echinospora TaxID=1877 RepID=UPI003CED3C25
MVEALNPERSLSRHPLFQVMLSLNNNDQVDENSTPVTISGMRVSPYRTSAGVAKFDLLFGFTERRAADDRPSALSGVLEFSADLFDEGSAVELAGRFVRL